MSRGVGTSVLVGRAEELATLDAAFGRVRDGRPSTMLIGGEAGIGKSRLAGEFGVQARAAGAARVLSGYCLELSAEGLRGQGCSSRYLACLSTWPRPGHWCW